MLELGVIGLGRMGGNMVRRLMRYGVPCVAHDRSRDAMESVRAEGAATAMSLEEFVHALAPPRHVWMMVPAGIVDKVIADVTPLLDPGDVIIDGGNSLFQDDIARAATLAGRGLHYVDCGVSGGVAGLERGYCLMIGGEKEIVTRMAPVFEALAPGAAAAPPTPGRTPGSGTAERGWLHCGPAGAGHFVKMIHNAIEYGMMAAYAEGFNVLHHAGIGSADHAVDAESTPLRNPEHYRYNFDLAEIAELWRRGSVIPSWLLDLTAQALLPDPQLSKFAGRVSDSGEGRWALAAANDVGVPAFVLAAALFERFASRGNAEFQDRLLSAMRFQFGGHVEKPKA